MGCSPINPRRETPQGPRSRACIACQTELDLVGEPVKLHPHSGATLNMEETSKPLQLPQIRPIRFLKSGMIELLRLRNFKLGFLVFNHGSRGDFPNSSRGYPRFPTLSILEYVNPVFKARFVGRRKPT